MSGINGVIRPGIVHRIDMNTTGSLLICKNDHAHQILAEQLKEHSISRTYHAIVHNHLKEEQGTIESTIGRHPVDRKKMAIVADGKPSKTEWHVLERLNGATYLDVHLLTGRTHQIRVHMLSVGHPLLGDRIYAPNLKCAVRIPRLMLHAYSLTFTHPKTGERMTFCAPLSDAFEQTLQKLR